MEGNNQKQTPVDVKTPKKIGVAETYAGDMAKVIERGEGGVMKKIIEEQEQHEAVRKNLSPESSKNRIFMIIGAVLVITALIVLVVLAGLKNKNSTVDMNAQVTPLVFSDKTQFKEISGFSEKQIFQTILNEASTTDIKNGEVEGVYFTENNKIVGLRRFLSLIKNSLSLSNINYVNDNFLLGIVDKETNSILPTVSEGISSETYGLAKGKDLFILLKTTSFLDAFSIIKNWEGKAFNDLHGLFGIGITQDNGYLLTKSFEDGFVDNKNAHILRDKDGQMVLEIVFANDNSIIITNKDEAAEEIIIRLNAGQIKK